ncbi:6733_t:CDS:2, partial [Racocetra persica]
MSHPVQQKYSCVFQGKAGEQRLKQLINYDYWNIRQDPKLKTIGYVLFVDNESSYEVNFSWSQSELKENNCIFQCGTVTCKFLSDSGEFFDQPAVPQTNHTTISQAKNSSLQAPNSLQVPNPPLQAPSLPSQAPGPPSQAPGPPSQAPNPQ